MRGITVLELLVTLVILGIIAAIAVPSMLTIIENAKKDFHIGNARAMVNAVRLMSITEPNIMPSENHMSFIPLGYMMSQGYIEETSNFYGDEKYAGHIDDKAVVNRDISTHNWKNEFNAYVVIANENGKIRYYVRLCLPYEDRPVIDYTPIEELTRDKVQLYKLDSGGLF